MRMRNAKNKFRHYQSIFICYYLLENYLKHHVILKYFYQFIKKIINASLCFDIPDSTNVDYGAFYFADQLQFRDGARGRQSTGLQSEDGQTEHEVGESGDRGTSSTRDHLVLLSGRRLISYILHLQDLHLLQESIQFY